MKWLGWRRIGKITKRRNDGTMGLEFMELNYKEKFGHGFDKKNKKRERKEGAAETIGEEATIFCK